VSRRPVHGAAVIGIAARTATTPRRSGGVMTGATLTSARSVWTGYAKDAAATMKKSAVKVAAVTLTVKSAVMAAAAAAGAVMIKIVMTPIRSTAAEMVMARPVLRATNAAALTAATLAIAKAVWLAVVKSVAATRIRNAAVVRGANKNAKIQSLQVLAMLTKTKSINVYIVWGLVQGSVVKILQQGYIPVT